MNLGTPEILIIALVVVLLFGATKLPQMARSLGQSARVFKAEARGLREDESGSSSGGGPEQSTGQQSTDQQSTGHQGTRQLDQGAGAASGNQAGSANQASGNQAGSTGQPSSQHTSADPQGAGEPRRTTDN